MRIASAQGALTFGLCSSAPQHAFPVADVDPFIAQGVVEGLCHVLWESAHVLFENREQGHDVGPASSSIRPWAASSRTWTPPTPAWSVSR